jgi:hypothetical protein
MECLTPSKKRGRNLGTFVWVRDGTQDHPAYILLQPTEEPSEEHLEDVQVQWQQTGHTAWVKHSAIQDAAELHRHGRSRKASDTALEAQKNAQEAIKKKEEATKKKGAASKSPKKTPVKAAAVAAKSPKKTLVNSPKKTPVKKAQTVKVKVTPKVPSSATKKAANNTARRTPLKPTIATTPKEAGEKAVLEVRKKEPKAIPVKKAQHTKVVLKKDPPKKQQQQQHVRFLKHVVVEPPAAVISSPPILDSSREKDNEGFSVMLQQASAAAGPKSATAAVPPPTQQQDEPSLFQSITEPLAHAKDAVVSGILGYFKGFMTNVD